MPRCKPGKIGVAIAVHCGTGVDVQRFREDFLVRTRQAIRQESVGDSFVVIELPQWRMKDPLDNPRAIEVFKKCNARFGLYGSVRAPQVKGVPSYWLTMSGIVFIPPMDEEAKLQLTREFNELFPGGALTPTSEATFVFETTAQNVAVVSKYIIAIAAAFAGDMALAERLFVDIGRSAQSFVGVDAIQAVASRVPIHLSYLAFARARSAYSRWRRKRFDDDLRELSSQLAMVREEHRELYSYRVLAAIERFVIGRRVKEARKLLAPRGAESDRTWEFGVAFLDAFSGRLDLALKRYRRLAKAEVQGATVLEVEEFIGWAIETEPTCVHLKILRGALNLLFKRDMVIAAEEIAGFLAAPGQWNRPPIISAAEALMRETTGMPGDVRTDSCAEARE